MKCKCGGTGGYNVKFGQLGEETFPCEVCSADFFKPSPISPEQREEINKFMDETMYTFATLEERYDQIGDARRLINLLLSSEQAWRERAERAQNEWGVTIEDGETLKLAIESKEKQLNQAMEVLKNVTKNLTKPTTAKCECETCLNVKYIDNFLSSLSQEGEI